MESTWNRKYRRCGVIYQERKDATCCFVFGPVSVLVKRGHAKKKVKSTSVSLLQRQTLLCLSIPRSVFKSRQYHMIKVLLLRAFRSIKKNSLPCSCSFSALYIPLPPSLPPPPASQPLPPSLEQSYGWYSLCMHMLSWPILDLLIKIEGGK